MEKRGGAYSVLMGKPEERTSLGTPRSRLQDNINICLQGMGMGRGVDWFDLAQGRWLAGSCEQGDKP
jgi:hypothetical protein